MALVSVTSASTAAAAAARWPATAPGSPSTTRSRGAGGGARAGRSRAYRASAPAHGPLRASAQQQVVRGHGARVLGIPQAPLRMPHLPGAARERLRHVLHDAAGAGASAVPHVGATGLLGFDTRDLIEHGLDRKSTRLNSSHLGISY